MRTKPIWKFSKRQAFYVSFAILFSTIAVIVFVACWKVHTIRLAESSGLYLEGTRDDSIFAKTQKVVSALDSIGVPKSTKESIARWFSKLSWKTDYIFVERTMSPELAGILSRHEFRNIESLSLGNSKVGLNDLAAIATKPNCCFLDLEHAKLDDASIPVIVEKFPNIEFINFRGVAVGGTKFDALSKLKSKTLGLNLNNNVLYSREDLETLTKVCPQLGYLRINRVDDETCMPILKCQNLWGLDLAGSAIRGEIVQQLHKLPKLKWLSVGGYHPNRDFDTMFSSPPIPTVERLQLEGIIIEENYIPQIARMFPNLTELWLPFCTLSPKSIADLSQLESLKILNLRMIKLKKGVPLVPIRLPITTLLIDRKTAEPLLKTSPSLKPLINSKNSEWIAAGDHPFFGQIDY